MAERNVTIRISAQDNFSQVLQKYNQAIGQANTQTQALANGTERSAGGFATFRNALVGIGGALAAWQVGRKALELRELGAAAAAASNTFTALSGGATQAASNLQMMREATRGMADDTTLMQGASRLLLMNLASTGEEAARLTEIAVNLGRAMGKDAASSIEEFSLLLSNRSILRLDNFGIAANDVRARIEELKEAGAGIDEAFNMAVMEVGAEAMNRLGSSIDENVRQWDRLLVRIKNGITDIGEGVADVGDVIASGANAALDVLEQIIAREEVLMGRVDTLITGGGGGTAGTGTGADPTGGAGIAGISVLSEQQRAQALEILRSGELDYTNAGSRGTLLAEQIFYGEVYDSSNRAHQALMQLAADYYGIEAAAQDAQGASEAHARAMEAAANAPTADYSQWRVFSAPAGRGASNPELARFQAQTGSVARAQQEIARRDSIARDRELYQEQLDRGYMGLRSYNARIESNQPGGYGYGMETLRQMSQREYAGQRQAHTQDTFSGMFGGLGNIGASAFSAAETAAQGVASAMAEARAQAQRIVSDFTATSKPTGPEADVYTQVANSITDPGQREAFLRSVNMTTWRDDSFEWLATLPAGEREIAARNVAGQMAGGWMPSSMGDFRTTAGYFNVPGSGGGGGYTIQGGDTLSAIAAANGMTVAQLQGMNPGVNPRALQIGGSLNLGGGGGGWQRIVGAGGPEEQGDAGFGMGGMATDPYQAAADATAEMAGNMTDAASAADEVKSALESIAGMVAQARIEAQLVVTGDTWAIPLLGASGALSGTGKGPGLQGASTVTANTKPRGAGTGGVQNYQP